jgi:Ni,Fe-hydrogenase III component G
MDTDTLLGQAEGLLQPFVGAMIRKEENRLDCVVEVKNLKTSVKSLMDARWGYLMAISGIDHPAVEEQSEGVIEVVYFFANEAAIAGLRVAVPYSNAVVPSICDINPSATLYERELIEMFGVDVEGTPVRDHLVLSDDWPDGVYPLRKSFNGVADIKGA